MQLAPNNDLENRSGTQYEVDSTQSPLELAVLDRTTGKKATFVSILARLLCMQIEDMANADPNHDRTY